MSVLVSLATIRPEHVGEVEAAGRRLFAAVDRAAPAGLRYAVCRLPDGTYVTLLEGGGPLRELPEFHEFMAGWPDRLAAPTTGGPAELIGSYRLFDAGP
jgi:hypothetical protein